MKSVYVFQENSLILPEKDADPLHYRGTDLQIVNKNFDSLRKARTREPSFAGEACGGLAGSADFFDFGEADTAALSLPPGLPLPPGWTALPLRQWLSVVSAETVMFDPRRAGPVLRAFHIAQWRAGSRFCGSCGTANTDAPDELARLCPACGRREYPRISPAVITLIINDEDKALLAHNNKFAGGMYSLIAGFTEAGESLEGAVEREIFEEVGLEIAKIQYVASQPWPFPNSLMLGFTCRHAGGEIKPDGKEITDARWFSRGSLPLLPGFGSFSRYLINRWIDGSL
ncbi:MAG: NAD(+) diphosphatase [Treponema sp.]|nr:NAD(+) diphosphatase [Treponema sp.]